MRKAGALSSVDFLGTSKMPLPKAAVGVYKKQVILDHSCK